jgi:hypothetical protein
VYRLDYASPWWTRPLYISVYNVSIKISLLYTFKCFPINQKSIGGGT